MIGMRVCWLSEVFPWMGPHSGYDVLRKKLAQTLDPRSACVFRYAEQRMPYTPDLCYEGDLFRIKQHPIAGNPFYDIRSYKAELDALELLANDHFDLLHVLNGENNTSELIGSIDRSRTKVVATFHQPISWWKREHVRPELLSQLDGLITVSSEAVEYFSQYLDSSKIFFIPLGVDVDYFCPADEEHTRETLGCLSVGHWMRDFTVYPELVKAVRARYPEFSFSLVLSEAARNEPEVAALVQLDGVSVISGVSDPRLRDLYRDQLFFFLPMIDGTANNAMLEAMSTGTPVLSTMTQGAADYLDTDYAYVVSQRRTDDFLEHFIEFVENSTKRRAMGRRARQACLERFSWDRIAQQTLSCYEKVIAS